MDISHAPDYLHLHERYPQSPVSRSDDPAPYFNADPAGRAFGHGDEHLSAQPAEDGRAFWHGLRGDSAFGAALSVLQWHTANLHWADIRQPRAAARDALGLGLFLAATVGCLLAPNIAVFLVFRMAQAVIATGMVLSRAVIRDLYTQDESASMIGYVTMGMALVPMISPALGGLLEQGFGWQASFWAMLILGGLVFWVAWADLGETARASGKSLGQQFGEYPELLRSPRFWGYALATGFCSGAFFAYLGGAPFVGTVVLGWSLRCWAYISARPRLVISSATSSPRAPRPALASIRWCSGAASQMPWAARFRC